MRVLVTGGTGLLGNNVVRLMLDRGHSVRVLVREGSDRRPLDGLDVEVVSGDVRDAGAVRRAALGCAAVVHAAGFVHLGWSQQDLHQAINVDGARHVAEAALAADARLVHVSTISTLGLGRWDRPGDEESAERHIVPCPYVTSKRAGEQAVLELLDAGLQAVFVHPGFLLGPWDWRPSSGKMLLEVERRWTPIAPGGGFSICDARDVAAGIEAALQTAPVGRHYVLAGHNMSYFDGWRLFARISGGRPPLWRSIGFGPILLGILGDVRRRVTGRETDLNSAAIRLGQQLHIFSSARAERELGYTSRAAEITVQDTWRWFQEHGYA